MKKRRTALRGAVRGKSKSFDAFTAEGKSDMVARLERHDYCDGFECHSTNTAGNKSFSEFLQKTIRERPFRYLHFYIEVMRSAAQIL